MGSSKAAHFKWLKINSKLVHLREMRYKRYKRVAIDGLPEPIRIFHKDLPSQGGRDSISNRQGVRFERRADSMLVPAAWEAGWVERREAEIWRDLCLMHCRKKTKKLQQRFGSVFL